MFSMNAHTHIEERPARMSRLICSLLFALCTQMLFAAEKPVLSRYDAGLDLIPPASFSGLQEFQDTPPSETSRDKKSPGLAALYSLLLPGMGELYADGFSSGKYFTIAEGALWLTYATLDVYGNSIQDDARSFAVSKAGVNTSGKPDQFFIDIGNFVDVYEYNEKQLRDREEEKLYDPNAGYYWRWESDDLRAQYREERINAENVFNNRKFVVAAIIVNHVASAINAARSAISYNAEREATGELRFGASVLGSVSHPHGILLTVSKGF